MGTFRPGTALTFDDVLLVPRHSSVHPRNVDVRSRFTRGIPLNIPLVSAAMDTVTEAEMAIAIAREGGIGVVHKNMPVDRQAAEVDRVKRSESGMILHPITLGPDRPVREAVRLMERFRISGVPIAMARARGLLGAGCDGLVVDSAHGHSEGVLNAVACLREAFPDAQIVGGNVASEAGARSLVERGVDAVKVGVGPGSICTTRVVTGVGVPQLTAVLDAVDGAGDVPVVADGGIKYSGDAVKALAAGASSVMMGSMLAGTGESPGEAFLLEGRRFKMVRGMGSLSAMQDGSGDRYFQDGELSLRKLVPEGIEGRVPYKGPVGDVLYQMVGCLRSGMGYVGCATIDELRAETEFVRITTAGLRESHPHDVTITREAPNYSV